MPVAGRDWEAWLQAASRPASAEEEEKRDRTEARIRRAIARSPEIRPSSVRIFVKGSYANNTNVRLDADVDIAVEWRSGFKTAKMFEAENLTDAQLNLIDADLPTPSEFRAQVERALIAEFGTADVDTSGNKAITVAGDRSTLDADVVPCFRMRRYHSRTVWHEGIWLYPKNGRRVENWPQQNYDNGVSKNKHTGGRYKKIVRCLKRLENDMLVRGVLREEVHSYLIECLVWNAANTAFGYARLLDDLRSVFRSIWTPLRSDETCSDWGEINELKYLFRASQRWTRQEAFAFIDKAWDEVGVS